MSSLLTLTGRPDGKRPDNNDLISTAGLDDGAHQAAPPTPVSWLPPPGSSSSSGIDYLRSHDINGKK